MARSGSRLRKPCPSSLALADALPSHCPAHVPKRPIASRSVLSAGSTVVLRPQRIRPYLSCFYENNGSAPGMSRTCDLGLRKVLLDAIPDRPAAALTIEKVLKARGHHGARSALRLRTARGSGTSGGPGLGRSVRRWKVASRPRVKDGVWLPASSRRYPLLRLLVG